MGTSELHFGMHSTGIPPLAGLDLFLRTEGSHSKFQYHSSPSQTFHGFASVLGVSIGSLASGMAFPCNRSRSRSCRSSQY